MHNTKMVDYDKLARKLARGGRFRVVLVSYPETPEVFEYISRTACAGARPTRYINVGARPGANISRIID